MSTKEKPREPVDYTVAERSLIGNEIFEVGAVVSFAGLPAENLTPMCDVGKARYEEYLDSNKKRIERMKLEVGDVSVGDADAFAKAFRKELATANAEAEERQNRMLEALAAGQAAQTAALADAIGSALAKALGGAPAVPVTKKKEKPVGPVDESLA